LKLIFNSTLNSWGYMEGEGNFATPLTTWYYATADLSPDMKQTNVFTSFRVVDYAACRLCTMRVFSVDNFTGKTELYDFRTQSGSTQVTSPFAIKSYTVKCYPRVEEDIDRSGEFPNVEWGKIVLNEDEELPEDLVEMRTKEVSKAVERLKAKGILPEGHYTISQIYPTEYSENYHILYRFNVKVSNDAGVRFRISATTYTAPDNLQDYEFITYAYFEHRLSEIDEDYYSWDEIGFGEEDPLDSDFDQLRSRAVHQAVHRLKAKGVLAQGQYIISKTFAAETTGGNFGPEFDMDYLGYQLFRYHVQVSSGSGVHYRLVVYVMTLGDDYTHYELFDYVFFEHRLGEFSNIDWIEILEDDVTLPLPGDLVELRDKVWARAVHGLQVEELLPEGNFTVTKAFATEFASGFEHREFPQSGDFILYRFNIQVMNESGVRFRIQAVTVSTYYNLPEYELIDFAYIENRVAEFNAPTWKQVAEVALPGSVAELRSRVVNQAVERMKVKGILHEGKYTLSKTFPTEFATKLEHPEFPLTGDYILYRYNVQITDESGVRYRISAISASQSFALSSYELIDFNYIENRLGEFSNAVFRGINEDELREKAVKQAVGRLIAKGVIPQGEYVIEDTFSTEFAAGFDHPEFPPANGDVLWRFDVEVSNGIEVFATVITNYDTPLGYELIDYGKSQ